MSEKFLKVFLTELGIVRVVCLGCKAVTEVTAAQLGTVFQGGLCPHCQRPLFAPSPQRPNPLVQLSAALTALQNQPQQTVAVEFPIKAP